MKKPPVASGFTVLRFALPPIPLACCVVAAGAAAIELENVVRAGGKIPMLSKVEDVPDNPEYRGFYAGLPDIDMMPPLGRV